MNDQRFDNLARDIADICQGRATRRDLFRWLGLGGAVVAGGGLGLKREVSAAAAPLEQTTAPNRAPGGPTIAQLAFDLAYDPEAIFRFVRDEIRYDPYPGVLRGAKGTLWGLAGNAADQAILLAALLAEGLVATRFVVGELDDAAADRLLVAARRDEATTRTDAQRVLSITGPGSAQTTPAAPTAEQTALGRQLVEDGQRLIETARTQIADTVQMLDEALETAGVTLPPVDLTLPERERTRHIWLQYAAGPDWIDLDPSFPDAEPGTVSATGAETLDALPGEDFHAVTIRAVAEVVSAGLPVRRDLLTYHAHSADLAGEPMMLLHITPQALKAVGVGVAGLLEGTTQYLPYLLLGDQGESGEAMTFTTGEGALDIMGDSGATEGEAIAEWLEFEIAVPDAPPRTIVREVFDRIGAARRAAGNLDLADLKPIALTDAGDGTLVYLPLQTVAAIAVSGHEIPGSYFLQDYAVADPVADMTTAVYGQHYLRHGLALDRVTANGYRLYPNAPNITMLSLIVHHLDAEAAAGQSVLDLVYQSTGAVPTTAAPEAPHPHLLAGVLGHAAERMVLEAGAQRAADAGSSLPSISVGRLFEVAQGEGVMIRTLLPGAAPNLDNSISDRAHARIAEALATGYVVVVPERAIALDGSSLTGWWQIDPRTGETFDRLETGMGAVALGPLFEDALLKVWIVVRNALGLTRLGFCVVMASIGAGIVIAGVGGGLAGALSGNDVASTLGVAFAGLGSGLALGAAGCAFAAG